MDFGVLSLDNGGGLMCSNTTLAAAAAAANTTSTSHAETKQKWHGSGFLKQERSAEAALGSTEDHFRDFKFANISCSNFVLEDSGQQQQMLSFSSPNSQTVTLPYYHHPSSFSCTKASGCGSGGLNAGDRGPFTPSQWMELEHQALIYKYINANVPIPSYLLNPIRKALDYAGFSTFAGPKLNFFGWGGSPLGFSNSTDPEPGRCRRTDGKKWRCSRDAVTDQKYCERHMNRGRHRSRKPVEGHPGHSVTGSTTTVAAKLIPTSSASAAVVPGISASNSLGLSPHPRQPNDPQAGGNAQCAASPELVRSILEKENLGRRIQDTTSLSITSPSISLKGNQYSISKLQNPYQESSRGEFGQVCSDSLLNPLDRNSSLVNYSNYGTREDVNDPKSRSHHGLHQFMDDWPNSESDRSSVSLPDTDMHSDRTQLSISISMVASDFMSSASSPTNKKSSASSLRLSREVDTARMGLGVGTNVNNHTQKGANWIPTSWEPSMGGPLAEVLHSTNNSGNHRKNVSSLNLMTEDWDASPHVASSPTGVLQKATFVSRSNSSTGSSPGTASQCSGAVLG